jgi:hypothetical protein
MVEENLAAMLGIDLAIADSVASRASVSKQNTKANQDITMLDPRKSNVSKLIRELEIPKPYTCLEREVDLLQKQYNGGQLMSESDATRCLCRLMDLSSELRSWSNKERRLRVSNLVVEAGCSSECKIRQ